MKKWLVLTVICCFFAGCDDGTDGPGVPYEPPFTGLTSVGEVESYLYWSSKGSAPNDPVELSVKISASEWTQLFTAIKNEDKFVALDLSHCYDVQQNFIRHMENYGDVIVSLVFPVGIKYLGTFAFRNCTNLKKIELPDSLTRISDHAFNGCTSLVLVICHATTPPRLEYEVFDNTSAALSIKVPTASVAAYKTAWSEYADKITAY